MKLELKVAGGQIKEPGYYAAVCTDAVVTATGKSEDDGTPIMLLELHCTVRYQDQDVEAKTGQYLTLGPDSKLTQLLLACGYAADYEAVVDRYTVQGLDSDFFTGKQFRICYSNTVGRNGKQWVKETGYAPLSKRATFGAASTPATTTRAVFTSPNEDDVPF